VTDTAAYPTPGAVPGEVQALAIEAYEYATDDHDYSQRALRAATDRVWRVARRDLLERIAELEANVGEDRFIAVTRTEYAELREAEAERNRLRTDLARANVTLDAVRALAAPWITHGNGQGRDLAQRILAAIDAGGAVGHAEASKTAHPQGGSSGMDPALNRATAQPRGAGEGKGAAASGQLDTQCRSRADTGGAVTRCQFYAGHTAVFPNHGVRREDQDGTVLIWHSWRDDDPNVLIDASDEDTEGARRG